MKKFIVILIFITILPGCNNSNNNSIRNIPIKVPDYLCITTQEQIQLMQNLHAEMETLANSEDKESQKRISEIIEQLNFIENTRINIKSPLIIESIVKEISTAVLTEYKPQNEKIAFIINFVYSYNDIETTNEKNLLKRKKEGYIESIVVLEDKSLILPHLSENAENLSDINTYKHRISEELYSMIINEINKSILNM